MHRLAAALVMILLAGATSADDPEGELSKINLTRHFGDLPTCADLGQVRSICWWTNPDYEHFTCVLSKETSIVSRSNCVYSEVDDRADAYFYVKDSYRTRGRPSRLEGRMELWRSNYDLAAESVNTGHILDVIRGLGHGPAACLVAETVACRWITNNATPGHQNISRYLAASNMFAQHTNDPVRLICEFDTETLERTDIPCSATYF